MSEDELKTKSAYIRQMLAEIDEIIADGKSDASIKMEAMCLMLDILRHYELEGGK